jgi:solute carrier family 36 (proton-coupled amino acid transporter)
VLGKWALILVDVMITSTQFSFILCYIIYITQSTHDLLLSLAGTKVELWIITVGLSVIILPLTLKRNLKSLEYCFSFGSICNVVGAAIIIGVLTHRFENNGHKWGENLEMLNNETYLSFVGFSIYSWEGIGVIMPIMEAAAKP